MIDSTVFRFFRQALISYKALFGFLDIKTYILVKIVNPIFQLIFFSLLAGYIANTKDVTPWIVGNAFLSSVYNALFGVGLVLLDERRFGTLKMVIASPSNNFFIFIGRSLIHLIDAIFTVILCLLVGALLFNIDFSQANIFLLLLIIFCSMFAAMGLGLLIGSFGLLIRDINLVLNTMASLLMILTGAQFPIKYLPYIFQDISRFIPITRGIEASKAVLHGESGFRVYQLIMEEFILGIIYMILGYISLRVIEKLAREKASLDAF
ncbi:ABC transporter permease [Bacillus cereus]|uniref:Transport permease protein n=1 Tax=Bacillus cereus HuA2-1 TaxID=1053201 RepID=J9B583_BACCE|nr:ABC transporter permease [Bacillus cereus]EJV74121.1 hypothetical protein IG3_05943 [Bacillus cereus HuA2-1]